MKRQTTSIGRLVESAAPTEPITRMTGPAIKRARLLWRWARKPAGRLTIRRPTPKSVMIMPDRIADCGKGISIDGQDRRYEANPRHYKYAHCTDKRQLRCLSEGPEKIRKRSHSVKPCQAARPRDGQSDSFYCLPVEMPSASRPSAYFPGSAARSANGPAAEDIRRFCARFTRRLEKARVLWLLHPWVYRIVPSR